MQQFTPSELIPSADKGNAFDPLPRIEAGDVLPVDHEIVSSFPTHFVTVPAGLHPDVRAEIVGLTAELAGAEAKFAAAGPEMCSQCGHVNTDRMERLAARVDDLKATLEAHEVMA